MFLIWTAHSRVGKLLLHAEHARVPADLEVKFYRLLLRIAITLGKVKASTSLSF